MSNTPPSHFSWRTTVYRKRLSSKNALKYQESVLYTLVLVCARWEFNHRYKTCFYKKKQKKNSLTQSDYQPNPHILTHIHLFILFFPSQRLLLWSSKHAQETCESFGEVINFIWVFGCDEARS